MKPSLFNGIAARLTAGIVLASGSSIALAEKFSFKIASGHGPNWAFVQIVQEYFIPEVKKRAKEKGHDVEFIEGWAGAMVKPTEVLEGLQSGIVEASTASGPMNHAANTISAATIARERARSHSAKSSDVQMMSGGYTSSASASQIQYRPTSRHIVSARTY